MHVDWDMSKNFHHSHLFIKGMNILYIKHIIKYLTLKNKLKTIALCQRK